MMTAGHAKSVCQRVSERERASRSRAGNGEISFSMALDEDGGEREPEAESAFSSVPSQYPIFIIILFTAIQHLSS